MRGRSSNRFGCESGSDGLRIDLCQIEIDELGLDMMELMNHLTELQSPTVDLVYARAIRTLFEEK
jgi:hypothetical protein